jgi:tRNA-dihydrouridine synthase B
MNIGSISLHNKLMLAPMAGITDLPFRRLCRSFGAALATTEMSTTNPSLRNAVKTRRRLDLADESAPRSVQLVGADPVHMAAAARRAVNQGAQIIDINMGCPARKVCRVAAGSALLGDERLVGAILDAVVAAVAVPVTLKIRTGLDTQRRNAVRVARIAEAAGIQAIAIHGRTRACGFQGHAEHATTRLVKTSVDIPVIANGDIDSPEQAARVLTETGADAVMIGRAALGRPWIFRDMAHYLAHGACPKPLAAQERLNCMLDHLREIHTWYGEYSGVRIARKHINWYLGRPALQSILQSRLQQTERTTEQLDLFEDLFHALHDQRLAA